MRERLWNEASDWWNYITVEGRSQGFCLVGWTTINKGDKAVETGVFSGAAKVRGFGPLRVRNGFIPSPCPRNVCKWGGVDYICCIRTARFCNCSSLLFRSRIEMSLTPSRNMANTAHDCPIPIRVPVSRCASFLARLRGEALANQIDFNVNIRTKTACFIELSLSIIFVQF